MSFARAHHQKYILYVAGTGHVLKPAEIPCRCCFLEAGGTPGSRGKSLRIKQASAARTGADVLQAYRDFLPPSVTPGQSPCSSFSDKTELYRHALKRYVRQRKARPCLADPLNILTITSLTLIINGPMSFGYKGAYTLEC